MQSETIHCPLTEVNTFIKEVKSAIIASLLNIRKKNVTDLLMELKIFTHGPNDG